MLFSGPQGLYKGVRGLTDGIPVMEAQVTETMEHEKETGDIGVWKDKYLTRALESLSNSSIVYLKQTRHRIGNPKP